jgi:hypothetical protein
MMVIVVVLADNYSISTGQTTTANITAKALTATASASNKVYDGNTTATVTLTFTGLVGSETLGQSVGATFADKNVANTKTVTVNSITLSDGDSGGLLTTIQFLLVKPRLPTLHNYLLLLGMVMQEMDYGLLLVTGQVVQFQIKTTLQQLLSHLHKM